MDPDPGSIGGMVGGLSACLITVIYLIIANRRRWKPGMKVQRTESFDTPFSPDELFAWLPGFAGYWLYEIEEQDAAQRRMVLSSKPTGTDWGFFFPLQLTPQPDGGRGTRVEVGIVSRATQYGPFVTRGHRQFIERLQNALAQATVPPPQQNQAAPMQNPWAQPPSGPPQPPPPTR